MDGSGRCPANSSYSILRYKEHKRVEQNDKEVRVACARGIDKERERDRGSYSYHIGRAADVFGQGDDMGIYIRTSRQ